MTGRVLEVRELVAQARGHLTDRLAGHGLAIKWLGNTCELPGSHWGAPEAGLIGGCLYVREDTPVHSLLHEACHYLCMDESRRQGLHTDAGGDYDEENAVCYLSILLAADVPGVGKDRMLADMDDWGYTFRLGSARAWFERDADDALTWLIRAGLVSSGPASIRPLP